MTDECCTDYKCKDNVTLIIVDLKKHFNDYNQKKPKEKRHAHSVVPRQFMPHQFTQPM